MQIILGSGNFMVDEQHNQSNPVTCSICSCEDCHECIDCGAELSELQCREQDGICERCMWALKN